MALKNGLEEQRWLISATFTLSASDFMAKPWLFFEQKRTLKKERNQFSPASKTQIISARKAKKNT